LWWWWDLDPAWDNTANIISPYYVGGWDSAKIGAMVISYLSEVSPNYNQPIQTVGHSLGAGICARVAVYMNQFNDARYNVNRVSPLDGFDPTAIEAFTANPIAGEQCWVDNYASTYNSSLPNVLNVDFQTQNHNLSGAWYKNSLVNSDMNVFNGGVIGGAYWSVVGPGKNLQLVTSLDTVNYKLKWHGSASTGFMDFYDEDLYPGRLPGPVTLISPEQDMRPNEEILLTCLESENTVGYQVLVGSDYDRVMDYTVISDTPEPPTEPVTVYEGAKYWTIKVRDQWGSTIYADPIQFSQTRMDFNGDGYTNLLDFSVVTAHWLDTGCQPLHWCGGTDVTFDGSVGLPDLEGFLDLWLVPRDWSLVGHWMFDEASGLVASHGRDNGLNATLKNFPIDDTQWVTGKISGALAFDGVDDYVSVSGYKGIPGRGARTVSAWIKTTASGELVAWGTKASPGAKWVFRVQSDIGGVGSGAIRVEVASGSIYGSTDVRDGQWHHVAAVLVDDGSPDVSEVLLYVNGALETVAASNPQAVNTVASENVTLGVFLQTSSRYFNGTMDDVRIYNRALDLSEIQTLANP